MSKDIVDGAVDSLTAWAQQAGSPCDPVVAAAVTAAMHDRGGPLAWSSLPAEALRGLVEACAAETGRDRATTVASVCTLLDYLAATGRLATAGHRRLSEELSGVAPRVITVPSDRWGAPRDGVADDGAAGGVPATATAGEAPLDPWAGAELSPELLAYDGAAPPLPPVRIAPPAELAAAARSSRVCADLVRLARWVGDRPVTASGVLRRADARQAMLELGLRPAIPADPRWPRSARDIPELDRRWRMAIQAGLLTVDAGRAGPGRTAGDEPGTDAGAIERWYAVLSGWFEVGAFAADPVVGYFVADQLPALLVLLYAAERAMSVDALADEIIRGDVFVLVTEPGDGWAEGVREALAAALGELAELGAVTVADGEVRLTALGTWGLRRRLVDEGYQAPVVGALAGESAVALLEGVGGHSADAADEEFAAWLTRRDVAGAATELLEAARGDEPARRRLAFALLDQVGAGAAEVVRDALAVPELRPYAATWLADHDAATDVGPSDDDTSWLLVDMGAALLDSGDPASFAEQLGLEIPADELSRCVESLWRVDHARTADVLTAIGDHHPDREVAKAARKASFRARSARI